MKTRIIIAVVMFICLSCSNSNPLSDPAREKIITEVKDALAPIIKGIEQVNPDAITNAALTTPEFTFQVNGMTGNYEQFTKGVTDYFTPLASQKIEMFNEKYAVLDNSTVLFSANCKCETNSKDGRVTLQDPWALQFLFQRADDKWKLASWTEYGSEKVLKNGSTPKEFNQVELMHQFTGKWKCDESPDSVLIWEVIPYGESFTVSARTVLKGKTINEETGVFAYDPLSDKILQARVSKNAGSLIAPLWFTSKNTAETVFLEDMPHPENAAQKATFSLVSPTEMTFTVRDNEKVLSVQKYKLTN